MLMAVLILSVTSVTLVPSQTEKVVKIWMGLFYCQSLCIGGANGHVVLIRRIY